LNSALFFNEQTMQLTATAQQLSEILAINLEEETTDWLKNRLEALIEKRSARDLYLTYTLLGSRIPPDRSLQLPDPAQGVEAYLATHGASAVEVARLYLLSQVLEADTGYFLPKVAQLIQVADTGELETFLRYLALLPHAEEFRQVAVEALRTNIADIFDAIALDNPYPALYFTEAQWNQMYLKAAFMQRDLGQIREVDRRANKDLARIISDYAHERWAASREVDPMFWRPVARFIEGPLAADMKRLLESGSQAEKRAAALCCSKAGKEPAATLLEPYPELRQAVKNGQIDWNNLKV